MALIALFLRDYKWGVCTTSAIVAMPQCERRVIELAMLECGQQILQALDAIDACPMRLYCFADANVNYTVIANIYQYCILMATSAVDFGVGPDIIDVRDLWKFLA